MVWQHARVRTYTLCLGHTLIPGSPHSAEQNHWDITKPAVTQGQRAGRKGQADMGWGRAGSQRQGLWSRWPLGHESCPSLVSPYCSTFTQLFYFQTTT